MMIFYRERLAFLAVPKTGTSALERALGSRASAVFRDPPGIKHTNARGFENKYRKLFERNDSKPLETMAIMRDPLDWLGSWFRYRQRPALSGHKNSTEGISFDEFVSGYLSTEQPPYAAVGSQARFVTDKSGNLFVNHLFSYHDFAAAVHFLEQRLDLTIALKPINESPKKTLTLSENLNSELRSVCAIDFEIYEALQEGPLSVS